MSFNKLYNYRIVYYIYIRRIKEVIPYFIYFMSRCCHDLTFYSTSRPVFLFSVVSIFPFNVILICNC